jgi:hypothetical protein
MYTPTIDKQMANATISIRIFHPTQDLSYLSGVLGVQPRHFWRSGEPRRGPDGASLGGLRSESYWSARLKIDPGADLNVTLWETATWLKRHTAVLRAIRSQGGRAELFVGWFVPNQAGTTLSSDLLHALGELGLDLSLDIYETHRDH